jgi:hypothetical protein
MPLAKLHVLEGQYDEARLGKVSSAVQNGLISALGIPPEDARPIPPSASARFQPLDVTTSPLYLASYRAL